MPESDNIRVNAIPSKSTTFTQRREDILKRLVESAHLCHSHYHGRKELATEKDETVTLLCETLEEAFTYGLKQSIVNASSLFQNVQEIVGINLSSNDLTFWDFCRNHLTVHERERFESLKNVVSKHGRGKAFIRASLNENSLQRYVMIWLNADDLLQYYSHWSLFLDSNASKVLLSIAENLSTILFAIIVDKTELNEIARGTSAPRKEEPVIFAPTPKPIAFQNKKKAPAIVRPIESSNSSNNLFDIVTPLINSNKTEGTNTKDPFDNRINGIIEPQNQQSIGDDVQRSLGKKNIISLQTKDSNVEEFLKQLNQSYPYRPDAADIDEDISSIPELYESSRTEDDKSESSSQYSKSSSALSHEKSSKISTSRETELKEKLQEITDRCSLLETRVAQLSLENRQLIRRLTQNFKETGIDPSSSLAANFLITIPQVKVLKSTRGRGKYCAYEIHITMRQNLEHWMIMRRYREFRELHKTLKSINPAVASVEFPPKKHFGNMNPVFIDERRQQLQIYLISLAEILPEVEACKKKEELVSVFPFFKQW